MTREKAVGILDAVIPPPEYHTVDLDHLQITQAWACIKDMLTAEPQRAYEQGVKDTLDKYDEDFRIASEVRIAVGCKTAKECWELARNGDIQVVKHGRNIATEYDDVDEFICSECGLHLENWVSVEADEDTGEKTYHEFRLRRCPSCGAQIDLTE